MRNGIWIGAAALLAALSAGAQESDGMQVETAVVALHVEEREPVGADTSFAPDVAELTCFSKVAGIDGVTHVYHVWIHGDRELARIKLEVRGPAWRTWSTKRILPEWTGDWKVEIRDADDKLLETVPFAVRAGDTEGAG